MIMNTLFLKLLNISITASWLVLAVCALRLLLKRTPKSFRCIMWAIVGIRLLSPFSFESVLSLIPSTETIPQKLISGSSFRIHTGIEIVDSSVNNYLGDLYYEGVTVSANNGSHIMSILAFIWLMGIIAMVIYTIASCKNLHGKTSEAAKLKDNIWICDHLAAPFILGIFHPRIFMPSSMSEADMKYVAAHERAHLKRHDHWWKPVGFTLLTVYWFNPFIWAAYILFCRDIELACDEKVLRDMGTDNKKSYCETLINCSVPHRKVTACPLAFGEVGVKERIKNILHYRRPTIWITAAGAAVCIALVVCFLTNPKSTDYMPAGDRKTYFFSDSADPMDPTIQLNEKDHSFQFIYSALSSYIAAGKYELTDKFLTLRTEDGSYTYVFKVKDEGFVFDGAKSSKIPEYKYSATSSDTECPVPDGAVFVLLK